MTQDDRDALADKRFQIMVDHLTKIDEQYSRFTDAFERTSEAVEKTSEAQLRLYNIKAEIAAAKLEKMRDNVQ